MINRETNKIHALLTFNKYNNSRIRAIDFADPNNRRKFVAAISDYGPRHFYEFLVFFELNEDFADIWGNLEYKDFLIDDYQGNIEVIKDNEEDFFEELYELSNVNPLYGDIYAAEFSK